MLYVPFIRVLPASSKSVLYFGSEVLQARRRCVFPVPSGRETRRRRRFEAKSSHTPRYNPKSKLPSFVVWKTQPVGPADGNTV